MSRNDETVLAVASRQELEQQLGEVRTLVHNGHLSAALILGWAFLEAAARLAFPNRLTKPLRPASVLEMLAYGGYISPSHADQIRHLVEQRNRLVHGELAVQPDRKDILEFLKIGERVHDLVQTTEAA